jgi:hypothetical protein
VIAGAFERGEERRRGLVLDVVDEQEVAHRGLSREDQDLAVRVDVFAGEERGCRERAQQLRRQRIRDVVDRERPVSGDVEVVADEPCAPRRSGIERDGRDIRNVVGGEPTRRGPGPRVRGAD